MKNILIVEDDYELLKCVEETIREKNRTEVPQNH